MAVLWNKEQIRSQLLRVRRTRSNGNKLQERKGCYKEEILDWKKNLAVEQIDKGRDGFSLTGQLQAEI